MELGEVIATMKDETPTVRAFIGRYTGNSGERVVAVTDDGQEIDAAKIGDWPQPGDQVHIVNIAGTWFCLGSTKPKQHWGRVTSVLTGRAVVEYPKGSGVTATLLTPRGVDPVVGNDVLIDWSNGGVITAIYGEEPEKPEPPKVVVPDEPVKKTTKQVFRATWTGTANPSNWWFSNDLWTKHGSGQNNRGCWGYGSRIKNAIKSGRTIKKARLYVPVRSGNGNGTTLSYHTLTGPSGSPSPGGSTSIALRQGWNTIPNALAQALISGGPGRGLMVAGGAGSSYYGIATNGMSGALELTWE